MFIIDQGELGGFLSLYLPLFLLEIDFDKDLRSACLTRKRYPDRNRALLFLLFFSFYFIDLFFFYFYFYFYFYFGSIHFFLSLSFSFFDGMEVLRRHSEYLCGLWVEGDGELAQLNDLRVTTEKNNKEVFSFLL